MQFRGTSTFTLDHVDARLAVLRNQGPHEDEAAEAERQREIHYLVDLRQRKSASQQPAAEGQEEEHEEAQAAEGE